MARQFLSYESDGEFSKDGKNDYSEDEEEEENGERIKWFLGLLVSIFLPLQQH